MLVEARHKETGDRCLLHYLRRSGKSATEDIFDFDDEPITLGKENLKKQALSYNPNRKRIEQELAPLYHLGDRIIPIDEESIEEVWQNKRTARALLCSGKFESLFVCYDNKIGSVCLIPSPHCQEKGIEWTY